MCSSASPLHLYYPCLLHSLHHHRHLLFQQYKNTSNIVPSPLSSTTPLLPSQGASSPSPLLVSWPTIVSDHNSSPMSLYFFINGKHKHSGNHAATGEYDFSCAISVMYTLLTSQRECLLHLC